MVRKSVIFFSLLKIFFFKDPNEWADIFAASGAKFVDFRTIFGLNKLIDLDILFLQAKFDSSFEYSFIFFSYF